MTLSEYIKLTKDTFTVEPGLSWLRALEDDVGRPIFSPTERPEPTTNTIMARTGQRDLVTRIRGFVDMPQIELDKLRDEENDNE